MVNVYLRQSFKTLQFSSQVLLTKNISINSKQLPRTINGATMPTSLYSKPIHTSPLFFKSSNDEDGDQKLEDEKNWMLNPDDPRDRTRDIPVELSIAYLESEAYRETYGNNRVKYYSTGSFKTFNYYTKYKFFYFRYGNFTGEILPKEE